MSSVRLAPGPGVPDGKMFVTRTNVLFAISIFIRKKRKKDFASCAYNKHI